MSAHPSTPVKFDTPPRAGRLITFVEGLLAEYAVRPLRESALFDRLRRFAMSVDLRENSGRSHAARVALYSSFIAEELRLPALEVERTTFAALLHDIGKVGVDQQILTKPTLLTPEEFNQIKTHPKIGADLIRCCPDLLPLVPGIELHHETMDGSGYPFGLKGDQLPMMARIVAVADTYDAMTSTRSYQNAMSSDYVMEIIVNLAGTKFDRRVTAAWKATQKAATAAARGRCFEPEPPIASPNLVLVG